MFSKWQRAFVCIPYRPVAITHVTLGYITSAQSPDGDILNAAREFSVYVSRTFSHLSFLGGENAESAKFLITVY